MSRTLPIECETCGEVIDWGDFGPEDDNRCICPPVTRFCTGCADKQAEIERLQKQLAIFTPGDIRRAHERRKAGSS